MSGILKMPEKQWDVFISHASEDKKTVARPLADALRRAGAKAWLDEHELKIGDSLSEKIDEGLAESQFGVVILSPAFLAKHWPRKELAGLRAREEDGKKVILPIWHNVDKATVRQFSPILADALAVSTEEGIDVVAAHILDVIFAPTSDSPSAKNPSVGRRLIEILEAEPKKETFLDFLRFHLPRTGRYLGWGGHLVMDSYEFYGMKFDAYAPYVGHGCRLALVSFTEAWKDPFDEGKEATTSSIFCDEVQQAISKIKSIKHQFINDKNAQLNLSKQLIDMYGSAMPENYRKLLEKHAAELWFFVFAGRRSTIDATTARHEAWSKLIMDNKDDIEIRSYDNIIDAFFDSNK